MKRMKITLIVILIMVNLVLGINLMVGHMYPREGVLIDRDIPSDFIALLSYMRGIKNGVFLDADTLDYIKESIDWSRDIRQGKKMMEFKPLNYRGFKCNRMDIHDLLFEGTFIEFQCFVRSFRPFPIMKKNMFTMIGSKGPSGGIMSLIGISHCSENRIYGNVIPIYGRYKDRDNGIERHSCASAIEEIPVQTMVISDFDVMYMANAIKNYHQ